MPYNQKKEKRKESDPKIPVNPYTMAWIVYQDILGRMIHAHAQASYSQLYMGR